MTQGDRSAGDTGTWDPDTYLRFAAYRARPAQDLIPRLELAIPGTVYDLGCGPGTLTKQLHERWPERQVVGIDSSPEMLADARRRFADTPMVWRQDDIAAWEPDGPAALVFSNAALHWVPDHVRLFPRLMRTLAPGGLFAVQMPTTRDAKYQACLRAVTNAPRWKQRVADAKMYNDPHPAAFYYDLLAPLAEVEVWETLYLHELRGEHPVTDWMRGTALVPVLSVLDDTEKADFLADYSAATDAAYARQVDGAVLLDMRRLFIVAKRRA